MEIIGADHTELASGIQGWHVWLILLSAMANAFLEEPSTDGLLVQQSPNHGPMCSGKPSPFQLALSVPSRYRF